MLWGRQVAGRNYPPTNKNTLIRALTKEWDKLPQQLLDNVVQSMERKADIMDHGDPKSFAALLENFHTNCSKTFDLNSAGHRLPLFINRGSNKTHLSQSGTIVP
ncbi:hypothetical protein TNCV_4062041 [Trichonephila clavipes]|nr:hypothetical protein TNCV_4062041 [Trichonephila clavipes]